MVPSSTHRIGKRHAKRLLSLNTEIPFLPQLVVLSLASFQGRFPLLPVQAQLPGRVATVQVRLNRRWLCRFAVITRRICQVVPPILGRVWLAHAQENQQQKLQLKETGHISTPGQFLSRHRCGTCPEIELPRLIVLFQK